MLTQTHKTNVLILCPTGQDAQLIAAVLYRDSFNSEIVRSIADLCSKELEDASVIIIAEEALTTEGIEVLNNKLNEQQPWSDIPIILFISGGVRNKEFKLKRLEVFVSSGNVTLLERPLQPITLLSATKVSMRARQRQYQVKELLLSQIAATKIRDEFISIAGHELKTPLTSLKLQTQMTRKHINRPEELSVVKIAKQLDYTVNQIDRLNKLVDDMLDISRLNTGKLQIQKSNFNLSILVEELVERFTPQFEAVGCSVEKDIDKEIIGFWDAYRLEQVLNNLFSNAIRYSPGKKISVGLHCKNHEVLLNVKDQGMGIEPENLERIFERFERISSSISGLGLGLYITRQILNLHNAKIKVESQLGQGANFIITLPYTKECETPIPK